MTPIPKTPRHASFGAISSEELERLEFVKLS